MPLVAGIDSSTQSTKVEVRDADTGELMAQGRAPHPPVNPPRAEQHPDRWWSALRAALAQVSDVITRVDAVSVAAQQHGMVVLDRRGEVVRPAKLWNDTESAPQARSLVEALGAPAWARAVGSVPVASFTVTKLAWLRAHEPDSYARLAGVLLPHDWLTYRLTGAKVTDRGDASGTGYWSAAEHRYRADVLALVDPDADWASRLPAVLGPTETVGKVNAELPVVRSALVGPGTGDNMAAALGLCLRPGDLVISLGTSGVVHTVTERPVVDPTGAVAGFADATGQFLPLTCTLNATRVTDAFARVLGVSHERLERLALAAPPGADGLVLVPYLDGERTPNRPEATGSLVGLRGGVTAEAVARAAHEGVVCGLLDALDALTAAGADTDGQVFLVGGGARSRAYQRIVADLTGRPVRVPRGTEHVAAGAAVQAAAALHGCDPYEVASRWRLGGGDLVEPDPGVDAAAIRAAYAAARG